jgi:hypothetical protein
MALGRVAALQQLVGDVLRCLPWITPGAHTSQKLRLLLLLKVLQVITGQYIARCSGMAGKTLG